MITALNTGSEDEFRKQYILKLNQVDSSQKQYLLQVVYDYRKTYPDSRKGTLMKK